MKHYFNKVALVLAVAVTTLANAVPSMADTPAEKPVPVLMNISIVLADLDQRARYRDAKIELGAGTDIRVPMQSVDQRARRRESQYMPNKG